MPQKAVRFSLILLLSLVAGTTFGIWLGFNPAALSAGAYIEQQQNAIRALNVLMPVMGGVCILLTIALSVFARSDLFKRALLVAATLLLVSAALVTRFGNQPINAVVMTWSAAAPPPNWAALRDLWWQWHVVRTAASVAALVLVLLAELRQRADPAT